MGKLFNNEHVAQVVGASAYSSQNTASLRAAASFVDFAINLAVFFLTHRLLRLAPVPQLWWVAAFAALSTLLWAGQKYFFGHTLGDRCWRLRADHRGFDAVLQRPVQLESSQLANAIFMTLMAVGVCSSAMGDAIFRQPLWAEASRLELDAYLPEMASGQWEILPFYFSLGAWPKNYNGKPVFHSLPYEKGPPDRFAGHIIARWDAPHTVVTFEGPKTPTTPITAKTSDRTPRDRIRACLLGSLKNWDCLRIREATLLRHLLEMQKSLTGLSGGSTALKMKWKLRWFTVRNAALPPAEQAQGIYLSATDQDRAEERYVLITENGTHQAIYLNYPVTVSGTEEALARKTFEQAIRSLRASDELGPGRAWINKQLEATRAPEGLSQIASAQAALIAKISVDPQVYDSYFHLGGTALVLEQIARKAPGAESLELAAIARPLIASAYHYAQDVGPQDPRTTQLQGFWLESKKP